MLVHFEVNSCFLNFLWKKKWVIKTDKSISFNKEIKPLYIYAQVELVYNVKWTQTMMSI